MKHYFALVCALAVLGCSAGGGNMDGGGGGLPDVMGGPENTIGVCRDGGDNDGDGLTDCDDPDCQVFVVCTEVDSGPGVDGFVECAGEETTADNVDAPIDIIWAVDSSSSMENDARIVQQNLDSFATFISGTGVDYHVIFVSDRGFVTPSPRFMSDPNFRFHDRSIGSQDVFARLLDQYSGPMGYSSFLRDTAITHVIGVTDDDDNMRAAEFIPLMEANLGHTFTFHAIAGTLMSVFGVDVPCTRGLDIPVQREGDRYFDAARATGGLEFSICTSDWSGLFSTLAMTVAITEALPCVYEIPPPPAGMTFNRDEVNVDHTPDGATMPTRFRRARRPEDCVGNAWYYDDDEMPTEIRLCPEACATVTGGPGTVEVSFGCASELI